jgi:hypothetical protein
MRAAARQVTLHATLHARPGERDWRAILEGLSLAIELGFDVYPAIGTGWSIDHMQVLAGELEATAKNLSKRLAVRPFLLSYAERYGRRASISSDAEPVAASVAWESILREITGSEYLATPRHEVELS